jgi:16S rRNA (adenine1518-N6/adenine1519-N6)-dimethyltransferase
MHASPAALLRQLGLSARKSMSQSFLTDERVCLSMADAAELTAPDQVLEIGSGLGILTRVLVERSNRVVAVELDRRLASYLRTVMPDDGLIVVQMDALRLDPADYFSGPYKLVANLPYQITSPVLTRFLVETRPPDLMIVMIQREVAERIAAPTGKSSYLSTLVRAVANVQVVRHVPPGSFYPRPKVTSTVLRIQPLAEPIVPRSHLPAYLQVVRAGFTQPRKTLANSIAQGLRMERSTVERWLSQGGISPTRRPQELEVADWLALYKVRGEGS